MTVEIVDKKRRESMPSLKPRMARPLKPENTMQQAGATWVATIMDERASTIKEDVIRLVEAQIAGNVDLSPEEMVDAAFLMVDRIDKMVHGKEVTTCSE